MPIYEFKCHDCEIVIEEIHSMKDSPSKTTCTECGEEIGRHYGSMSFVLKGEGWPSKNIRRGKPPISDKKRKINTQAKTLEDVQETRAKAGMDPGDKEVPKTEAEIAEDKKNIQRWIDETS